MNRRSFRQRASAGLRRARTAPPTAPWQGGGWRRDFGHGAALVNPVMQPATVTLEPGFRRLRGRQDSTVNNREAVATLILAAKDGIILSKSWMS